MPAPRDRGERAASEFSIWDAGDLWAYLEDLGVAKGEVHPVFGKPELQLETMEKQK